MHIDCFLCLESFNGPPLLHGNKSPSLWPALSCSSCISNFSFHKCCTSLLSLPGNLLAPSCFRAFAHAVPATWSSLPALSYSYFLSVLQFSSQMSWIPKTHGPIIYLLCTCHAFLLMYVTAVTK